MKPELKAAIIRLSRVSTDLKRNGTAELYGSQNEFADDIALLIAEANAMADVRIALYGEAANSPGLTANPTDSILERACNYQELKAEADAMRVRLSRIEREDNHMKRLADAQLVRIAGMEWWHKDIDENLADAVERTVRRQAVEIASLRAALKPFADAYRNKGTEHPTPVMHEAFKAAATVLTQAIKPDDPIALIAAERHRHITAEGWTPAHDDAHRGQEMASAAACYAMPSIQREIVERHGEVNTARGLSDPDSFVTVKMLIPPAWPWAPGWWKPSPNDRVRELVKAGALIVAEIERLQRAGDPVTAQPETPLQEQTIDQLLAHLPETHLARQQLNGIRANLKKRTEQIMSASLGSIDTEIVDWLASFWDSQNVGLQSVLAGFMVPNPTGSFRDAMLATKTRAGAFTSLIGFDLIAHLHRQREFSLRTFGPGERTAGNLAHIRKELVEIESKPYDLTEWIDVVLLALDGALRHGGTPESIATTLHAKQSKNMTRTWPDWRTVPEGEPICHVTPPPA